MVSYTALPFSPAPQEKVSRILRQSIRVESLLDDYKRGCDSACGDCPDCQRAMAAVAWKLSSPGAVVYEVWDNDNILGILYLTDIVPGTDAEAHFVFWDGKLVGRETIIERTIQEIAFGKLGLHRISIAIPEHAKALGRFVTRKLGFSLEGTKRERVRWRGKWEDVSLYGRIHMNGAK